jgi:hypothetical protein
MALPKPKLRLRSYTEHDFRSKSLTQSPISITPNDVFASPTVRIKSYYERRLIADKSIPQPKYPSTATPTDRVVMIVHTPDHDLIGKDSVFQDGKFDWSGKGNHVDYLPDEIVELEQSKPARNRSNR